MLAHRGDVAADGAEVSRSGERAPRAGDLLLELDHADVAFGLVVVERHGEVDGEPEDVGSLGVEPAQQVERLLLALLTDPWAP